MNSEAGFIEDGYTTQEYIAREPGVHPALDFERRALTPPERTVYLKDMQRAMTSPNSKQSELVAARILSECVKGWDLKRPSTGEIVPITPENMARIQPSLADKLWAIVVMGNRASDQRPDAGTKSELKPDLEQAEADAKN